MDKIDERIKHIEQFASQCYEDGNSYSAFMRGAIWADCNPAQDVVNLNDLWHDVIEEPKDRSNILVRYTYLGCAELKSHRINYNHLSSWSEFVDFNEVEEWAYVSDLLPKGGKK